MLNETSESTLRPTTGDKNMSEFISLVQLNKYETASNFIQLSQNFGLFVDLCVFTCFYQFLHDVIIKLFCFDHIMQKLVKTGKNTEINKQSDVKFWLN